LERIFYYQEKKVGTMSRQGPKKQTRGRNLELWRRQTVEKTARPEMALGIIKDWQKSNKRKGGKEETKILSKKTGCLINREVIASNWARKVTV